MARKRGTTIQCRKLAVAGKTTCRYHGGNGGGDGNPRIDELNARRVPILRETMKDNALAVTHGLFAKKILTDEEHEFYDNSKSMLREKYPDLDEAADEMLLHMVCIHAAKLASAYQKDHKEGIEFNSGRIRLLMKDLGIRKDQRTGGSKSGVLTPAELAAAVLSQAQARGLLEGGRLRMVEMEIGAAPRGGEGEPGRPEVSHARRARVFPARTMDAASTDDE
ncbi:hypothetical protein K8I61_17400 [bacterium]|nr:hypothetical protein [bacterium]